MLYSQGVKLEDLGVRRIDGGAVESDPRKIWRRFAERLLSVPRHADAALARPCLRDIVRPDERLSADNADLYYDTIDEALKTPEFRPRALFERFNIEVIATTESRRSTS